jgi:hypothetical protein
MNFDIFLPYLCLFVYPEGWHRHSGREGWVCHARWWFGVFHVLGYTQYFIRFDRLSSDISTRSRFHYSHKIGGDIFKYLASAGGEHISNYLGRSR